MVVDNLRDRVHGTYKNIDPARLTRFEKRAMWQIVDEERRIGRFQRMMPCGDPQYGPMFERAPYLNELAACFVAQGLGAADLEE